MQPTENEKAATVADDGGAKAKRFYKPRAQLFKTMSLLWVAVSVASVVIIGGDFRLWVAAGDVREAAAIVTFEQWIALALLLLHPLFILLAFRYHRSERPKEIVEETEDGDPGRPG